MTDTTKPRVKDIRLRFRGADADTAERLLENVGKAIGHPGEHEIVILAALSTFAGTLGVR